MGIIGRRSAPGVVRADLLFGLGRRVAPVAPPVDDLHHCLGLRPVLVVADIHAVQVVADRAVAVDCVGARVIRPASGQWRMIFCSFFRHLDAFMPLLDELLERLEPVPISCGSKLLLLCSEYGEITRLSPNSSARTSGYSRSGRAVPSGRRCWNPPSSRSWLWHSRQCLSRIGWISREIEDLRHAGDRFRIDGLGPQQSEERRSSASRCFCPLFMATDAGCASRPASGS